MTLDAEILAELSPRAHAWLNSRPLTRMPEWRLTDTELRSMLEALDLPCSEAMADYERRVGGWRHAEDAERKGFGFGVALRQGPGRRSSAIAKELATWRDVFDGPTSANDDGALIGLGYPHVFFQDTQLVPFGMLGEEHAYFVSEIGAIYRYWTLGDTLRIEADTCLSWLESCALEAERMSWSQVHIAGDVASLALELLECGGIPVVSDGVQTVWASTDSHVALVRDRAPNEHGTMIASKDARRFADALKKIIQEHPGVGLSGFANGIQGGRARGVLAAVGIDY